MEPASPPKRMTRARAAAKTGDAAPSRATAATASSRARTSTSATSASSRLSSATSTTASAAAKRKLHADDVDTDNDQDELAMDRPSSATHKVARVVRGRPKKVATEAPTAAPAAPETRPRGRPPSKKAAIPDAARPSSRLSTASATTMTNTITAANTSTTTATAAARAARAKKAAAAAHSADEDTAAEDTEGPAKKRATRSRATSAAVASSGPAKISVRSASATVAAKTSAPPTAPTTMAASRKKVSFEEPEKENIAPPPAAGKGRAVSSTKVPTKAPSKVPTKAAATETAPASSAGLKSKPVRRGAAAASTTTTRPKSASSTATLSDKANAPLSPKKVTQIRMARDYEVESEDELGTNDDYHLKPFERSPIKPPVHAGSTPAAVKILPKAGLDLDLESSSRDISTNLASLPAPDFNGVGLLASPARRLQSPAKGGIVASPARRLDGLVPHESAMAPTAKGQANAATNNHTGSVLFSPAKRFAVSSKGSTANGSNDTLCSPLKMSLLQSPAKRPSSPKKAAIMLQRPELKLPTLAEKTPALAPSPEVASVPAVPESHEAMTEDDDETEEEMEDADEADEADVSDDDEDMGVDERTESLTQMLSEMASEAASASAISDSPTRRRLFTNRPSASPARIIEQEQAKVEAEADVDVNVEAEADTERMDTAEVDEHATEDEAAEEATDEAMEEAMKKASEEIETIALDDNVTRPVEHAQAMDVDESVLDAATALVAMSPPKPAMAFPAAPSGMFGLRAKDLDMDDGMESDDEPTTRLPIVQNNTLGTPCAIKKGLGSRTPSSRVTRASLGGQSTAKRSMAASFGFTPLANQLNGWKASSPTKMATPTPAFVYKAEVEEAELEVDEADEEDVDKTEDEVVEGEQPEDDDTDVEIEVEVDAELEAEAEDEADKAENADETNPESTAQTADEDADLMDNIFVDNGIVEPEFDDDVAVTMEDLDLAQEANEMSLMEPAELDDMLGVPEVADDAMSEASQEYGDENAIPIDPALLSENDARVSPGVPPTTPQRTMVRTFHTVSKVPLKPADDSTPEPARLRRRSLGAPRLPASRRRSSISLGGFNTANNSSPAGRSPATTPSPSKQSGNGGLTRSATVISYSPTKKDGRRRESRRESLRDSRRKSRRKSLGPGSFETATESEDGAGSNNNDPIEVNIPIVLVSGPVTPVKSEPVTWSNVGTPARTPRRDLDPALLRGAVVFVDVFTSEGADASAIFIELLSQMGAQCVKRWSWNPSESDKTKPGITHVVFKDGSKRTLEKVRDSNGVVQCVGVSWVLDCERENEWLGEAPYHVETLAMPRVGGGGGRRKTMEPQAFAKMNGMELKTPPKQTLTNASVSARECRTVPATPMNRRDSALWVRTPEDERSNGDGDNDEEADGYGEPDWTLTPVPKTPAPEAIARYAANVSPSTPYGSEAGSYYGGDDDDTTISSVGFDNQAPLITRTCPPKQRAVSYNELGAGILAREKDQGVLMRLMAARRKSLQFAPKIASPLSKQWREHE